MKVNDDQTNKTPSPNTPAPECKKKTRRSLAKCFIKKKTQWNMKDMNFCVVHFSCVQANFIWSRYFYDIYKKRASKGVWNPEVSVLPISYSLLRFCIHFGMINFPKTMFVLSRQVDRVVVVVVDNHTFFNRLHRWSVISSVCALSNPKPSARIFIICNNKVSN